MSAVHFPPSYTNPGDGCFIATTPRRPAVSETLTPATGHFAHLHVQHVDRDCRHLPPPFRCLFYIVVELQQCDWLTSPVLLPPGAASSDLRGSVDAFKRRFQRHSALPDAPLHSRCQSHLVKGGLAVVSATATQG